MAWKPCSKCDRWYSDAVWVACATNGCESNVGKVARAPKPENRNQPNSRVNVPPPVHTPSIAVHGGAAPKVAAVIPVPTRLVPVARVAPVIPPKPQFAKGLRLPSATTAATAAVAAAEPEENCPVCCCDYPASQMISSHCNKYRLCRECGGDYRSWFDRQIGHVKCPYCRLEIDPAIYTGVLHADLIKAEEELIAKGRGQQVVQALSPQRLAWQGRLKCPHCNDDKWSYTSGCDVMTCPSCSGQYSAIDGSARKAGLAHTYELEAFYGKVQSTDERSSFKIFMQLKDQHRGVWASLYLDELLEALQAVRGDSGRVQRVLDQLSDAVFFGVKALLLKEFKKS